MAGERDPQMTPEDEKRIRELILEKLNDWSLDISKYSADPLIKDDYTGSYTLTLKHIKTGRKLKIPHIFVNEERQIVSWDNVEMK
jgi:hypothetical protein